MGYDYDSLKKLMDRTLQKDKTVTNMSRQDLSDYLSELHYITDHLSSFMRDKDLELSACKSNIVARLTQLDRKFTATEIRAMVQACECEVNADKDWAERQMKLLNSMMINCISIRKNMD